MEEKVKCNEENCDCEKEETVEETIKPLDEKERYRLKKLFVQKKQLDKKQKSLTDEMTKWNEEIHKLLKLEKNAKIEYDDLLIALI